MDEEEIKKAANALIDYINGNEDGGYSDGEIILEEVRGAMETRDVFKWFLKEAKDSLDEDSGLAELILDLLAENATNLAGRH